MNDQEYERIQKSVDGIRKADPTLSYGDALGKVFDEDPELYQLYRQDPMTEPKAEPIAKRVRGLAEEEVLNLAEIEKRNFPELSQQEAIVKVMRSPDLYEKYRLEARANAK